MVSIFKLFAKKKKNDMQKFLIVGLGNIGVEYNNTRHNIGFDVVDYIANLHKTNWKEERLAFKCIIKIKGKTVILIKPTTFMNLSGKAMKYWLDKEKIAIENSLVVVDDLALPLNKFRLRNTGSDAGHNGLKDIQLMLQTTTYPRLRFGIGSNFSKGNQVSFVLGKWKQDEMSLVNKKIEIANTVIEKFVLEGITNTMNYCNNLVF